MDLLTAIGTGAAGGVGGGALLLLILRFILSRQTALEGEQKKLIKENAEDHAKIRLEANKKIKTLEDCVEGELKHLNSNVDKIITVLSLTNDDPRVAKALKD